jgi:hypothetical protein
MNAEDIKNKLIGKHVKVHNLDFEVFEKDRIIRVIPHAEQVTDIKTLPITHIELDNNGGQTNITISSKMRQIDSGGPILVVIFCFFLLIAGAISFVAGKGMLTYAYLFGGAGVAIFLIFWIRMERGYFDYVRKVRDYIKTQSGV